MVAVAKKFTKQDMIETRDELRLEAELLAAQLAEKQELIASFDRILRDFFKTDDEGSLPASEPIELSKRFVGLSNSEAILQFLREQGDQFIAPSVIKRELLAGGITSNSQRFDTVVLNECRRLVTRGQLEAMSDYGNYVYRLKQPGDEKP